MTRTRIKICGITNLEDAQAAVDYGADALGFIFVSNSPRCVTTEAVYEMMLHLPPFVTKVAVVQDFSFGVMSTLPRGINYFQYYTAELRIKTGYNRTRRIRAYRVQNEATLEEIARTCGETSAILLDTYHKDKLGGSGETFNWELAVEAKRRFGLPVILAGGLTPENVGDAVRRVRPYAVDVSSGVEADPGRKDHTKLRAFIKAVREADADS